MRPKIASGLSFINFSFINSIAPIYSGCEIHYLFEERDDCRTCGGSESKRRICCCGCRGGSGNNNLFFIVVGCSSCIGGRCEE